MPRSQQLEPVPADYLIMIAAFRYALDRQSYMVEHVASWIGKHADTIPEHDARLVIREIDEQARLASLGMEMDERVWRRLQVKLRASIGEAA
jgi:hypothetical protein